MQLPEYNVNQLSDAFAESLANPDRLPPAGKWVNGRIVAVLGSPDQRTTTDFAFGVSVLPAGVETPTHTHRAEELALIIKGSGVINIGEVAHPVEQGDLLRTPAHAPHSTRAAATIPMHVLWIYAPAGSEQRWLAETPEES